MTDKELQARSDALRVEWKAIMAEFNRERDRKTPLFPSLNSLLMGIIETVEEERQGKSTIDDKANESDEKDTSNMFIMLGGIEERHNRHNVFETFDDATFGAFFIPMIEEFRRRCDVWRQDSAISSSKRLWYWIGVALAERLLNWAGMASSAGATPPSS